MGELSLNNERYRFADDTVICDRGRGPVYGLPEGKRSYRDFMRFLRDGEASMLLVLLGGRDSTLSPLCR